MSSQDGTSDGTRLTIYTSEGDFTVDLANNTFTVPGATVYISAQKAAEVATWLQIAADDPATQFQNALSTNTGPFCYNDGNGQVCEPYAPIDPRAQKTRSRSSSKLSSASPQKVGPRRGQRMMGLRPDDVVTANPYYPDCTEIAMEIYNHTHEYQAALHDWKEQLKRVVKGEILQLEMRGLAPPEEVQFADAILSVVETMEKGHRVMRERTILNFLAIHYGYNNCWDMRHSNWMPSTGGGGGSRAYGCEYEFITITFSDGTTNGYMVPVCEYIY